jgi:type VI secretion system protein ImpF
MRRRAATASVNAGAIQACHCARPRSPAQHPRCHFPRRAATYPACRESIVNFGLADFAQLCLTSSTDRKKICDLLTAAIVRNEPRLTQVRARLVEESGRVNRLSFAISGQLRTLANDDRVQFDIMLEPSSLQYAIR